MVQKLGFEPIMNHFFICFIGLYPEAPIITIPIIPNIMGDIPKSSVMVKRSIAAIAISAIPIQNIDFFILKLRDLDIKMYSVGEI